MQKMLKPSTKGGRMVLGGALVVGGIFGFLPILGFWMIPLGLVVLSEDFPVLRRFRRKWTVRLGRWWKKWRMRRVLAQKRLG